MGSQVQGVDRNDVYKVFYHQACGVCEKSFIIKLRKEETQFSSHAKIIILDPGDKLFILCSNIDEVSFQNMKKEQQLNCKLDSAFSMLTFLLNEAKNNNLFIRVFRYKRRTGCISFLKKYFLKDVVLLYANMERDVEELASILRREITGLQGVNLNMLKEAEQNKNALDDLQDKVEKLENNARNFAAKLQNEAAAVSITIGLQVANMNSIFQKTCSDILMRLNTQEAKLDKLQDMLGSVSNQSAAKCSLIEALLQEKQKLTEKNDRLELVVVKQKNNIQSLEGDLDASDQEKESLSAELLQAQSELHTQKQSTKRLAGLLVEANQRIYSFSQKKDKALMTQKRAEIKELEEMMQKLAEDSANAKSKDAAAKKKLEIDQAELIKENKRLQDLVDILTASISEHV